MNRVLKTLLFGVGSLLLAGSASWAETLRMAHIYPPGNIWYETAERFAAAVEERTNGEIKIQIAHSGSTSDWPAAIEGLLIGTNDIVLQGVGTLDRYDGVAAVQAFPYLIRDLDHFRKVFYSPVGEELYDEIAEKTKFRIIGAGYGGARYLTNNKPIKSPEDLAGNRLRVPPLRMYQLTWEYLGASPVPMGTSELFTSLQNGVVDGQENPLELIDSNNFYEVQKYAIATRHVFYVSTFIFSDERFARLAPDTQQILREEGERAMLDATERMEQLEGELEEQLKAKGMEFIEVDISQWRERVQPMINDFPDIAEWVERIANVE